MFNLSTFFSIHSMTFGWLGVILGFAGVISIILSVIPIQIKEAFVKDGIRATRIALPILTSTLVVLFLPTLTYYAWRLIHFQAQIPMTDFFGLLVGFYIFLTGVCLTIIYHKGGVPNEPTE